MTQPDEIQGLTPPVLRLELVNGTMVDVSMAAHEGDRFRPYIFITVVPLRQWTAVTALHINDWPRHVQVFEPDGMISHGVDGGDDGDARFLLGMYRLTEYYTMVWV